MQNGTYTCTKIYLCGVALMVQKGNRREMKKDSFVDDQLTCCPSIYFVSKSNSRKYVFIGKKHTIYHDMVQIFDLSIW